MICPNCGVENPVGAKFCKNCGFKLGETAPQQNNIPQPPPPPPGAQPPSPPPPPPPSGGANYGGGGYTQPPSQPPEKGESWWNSLIFCLLFSLFCCWPIGVVLYWTNPVASKKSKIIFTAIFVGLFIIIMVIWLIFFFAANHRATPYGY